MLVIHTPKPHPGDDAQPGEWWDARIGSRVTSVRIDAVGLVTRYGAEVVVWVEDVRTYRSIGVYCLIKQCLAPEEQETRMRARMFRRLCAAEECRRRQREETASELMEHTGRGDDWMDSDGDTDRTDWSGRMERFSGRICRQGSRFLAGEFGISREGQGG